VGGRVRRNTNVVGSYFYWIDYDYMFRPCSTETCGQSNQ